ncbi:MAG: DNA-protecting protein DprA, partial [Gammaproteobacteria bacterium]|nr:DNA-protecting protein DprA [Gammaproteobacteria bacterium]
MDSAQAWLILARAPALGTAATQQLLQRFESAENIVVQSRQALSQAGLGNDTIDAIVEPDRHRLDEDLTWLKQSGHHLLWRGHPDYPQLLAASPAAPAWLFVRGSQLSLLGEPQLAIVGSRNPTPTGAETALAFARHLAGAGLIVTSGLAAGIDTAAHRGALAAAAPTIAVCGTGLDRVFPRSAHELAHEIAANGLLVSEFPPGTGARRAHFPQRNRIIAGLTVGTLVVEAAHRSGALITAHR